MNLYQRQIFGYKKDSNLNGLYFYLKFNGDVLDSSIPPKTTYQGSDFTYQEGLYSGVANNCVLYDSSSQIITADATDGQFSFGNGTVDFNFSLGAIIKPSSNGTDRVIIAKGNYYDGLAMEYYLGLLPNNTIIFQVDDQSTGGYKNVVTTFICLSGNVYNIDAVYLSGVLSIYVDGVLQPVTSSSSGTYVAMEVGNVRAQIGKLLSFNAFLFRGNMDEVQVWSRALGPVEILEKHNNFLLGIPLL